MDLPISDMIEHLQQASRLAKTASRPKKE